MRKNKILAIFIVNLQKLINQKIMTTNINMSFGGVPPKPCIHCWHEGYMGPQGPVPGDGKCKTCKGTGISGSFFTFDRDDCKSCRRPAPLLSTGKCFICNGTGYMP